MTILFSADAETVLDPYAALATAALHAGTAPDPATGAIGEWVARVEEVVA